jgi:hypothetical protein
MKFLGISSSKIASITFLLVAIFLALFLGSFEFLKSNNIAEVPVLYEGMEEGEEVMEDDMEEDIEEGMEEGSEEVMEEDTEEGEEMMEEGGEAVEGFDVRQQSLRFSLV